MKAHFLLMFALVIRLRPREGRRPRMARDSDHLASSFETENTGGPLTGVLAEEQASERRAVRRGQVAARDLARQSQQIQFVARESQNETRRLASAIDTLNGDRDRLYSRVTVLEQGLDSVTGAIARQNATAGAPA